MKATFEVINQMQSDGVIGKYAIGGWVGAAYYLEPRSSHGIEIFVALPKKHGDLQISLAPIYDYLASRGYKTEKEHVVIEGWRVQFLSPSDALGEEALAQAIETKVEEVKIWVMTAEHLVAIALQKTGFETNFFIEQFIEFGVLDHNKLTTILSRFGLLEKWENFVGMLEKEKRENLENKNRWENMEKDSLFRKIYESKRESRKREAALPFPEKLKILEELRVTGLILEKNRLEHRLEMEKARKLNKSC